MLFFFFSVSTTGAGLTAFAAAGTVPVLLYEDGLYCGAILFAAGADVLVAGNAVFKSDNPIETIRLMKK